jgi:hypothetical protein
MIEEILITIKFDEKGVHVNTSTGNPILMLGMLEVAKKNISQFIASSGTATPLKPKRKKKVDSTKTWEEKK